MRNVVIPLEITEISDEILPVIRRVFQPQETKLTLLIVHEPIRIPPIVTGTPMMDGMLSLAVIQQSEAELQARQQQAQARLQEIAQLLRAEGYAVTPVVLEGEVVGAIANFVNARDFDVLAMATFGRTGLDRLLNGSIAESLLRQVATPMLLIRHQPEQKLSSGERLPRATITPMIGNGTGAIGAVIRDGYGW